MGSQRHVATRITLPLALALLAATGAAAQPAPGRSTLNFGWELVKGARPAGAVVANGVRVITLRGKGWASVSTAKSAAAALQRAALQGLGPGAVYAKQCRGGYAVVVGEERLLLVDSAVARAMKSSREALAQRWAARLRQFFAGPYLSLPVAYQVVPVGERRIIPIRGARGRLRAAATVPVVQVTCDPAGHSLSLVGMAPGAAQVVLDAGPAQITLPVQVMKYAGWVTSSAEAVVTGRAAPLWAIKRAASAAVYYSIFPEPGASAQITGIVSDTPVIAPGESAAVSVEVTLQGAGYLPVRATPRVRVSNQPIAPVEATVLMVSNQPERLPSTGLWYEGRIPQGHPARLLYHHVNASPAPAELAVELVNPADRPLRVQVVEASGGPSNDEVFAGHKAAREFLERQAEDVGWVVSLPPGCSYTVSANVVKREQVMSGLAELRVLDPGELRVRVRLRPPSADLVAPVPVPEERLSKWVFSEPSKHIEATYRVGQEWAFATIGDKQVLSSSGRELLDGDYGVSYDVTFTIENPTTSPAALELGFMPAGGLARGLLMIDGRIYETRLLRYGETQPLYGLTVLPGARQELRVGIMPEAGSNYPVKLVLRPRGVRD